MNTNPREPSEMALDLPSQAAAAPTLLVVDDEADIRQLEARALAELGYRVFSAAGPVEALLQAAVTPTIDLLLTDYSMPEADGLEFIHWFRAVHPKTPVLMVSGSLEMLNGDAADLERFETLSKPFTVQELVQKVRTLLNETPHPAL